MFLQGPWTSENGASVASTPQRGPAQRKARHPAGQESPFLGGGLRWLPQAPAGPRLASSTTYWPPEETRRLRGHLSWGLLPTSLLDGQSHPCAPRPPLNPILHPRAEGKLRKRRGHPEGSRSHGASWCCQAQGQAVPEQKMRQRGSRWAAAGRGTRRAGEGMGRCWRAVCSLPKLSGGLWGLRKGSHPAQGRCLKVPPALGSSSQLYPRAAGICLAATGTPAGVRGTFLRALLRLVGREPQRRGRDRGRRHGRGFQRDRMGGESHVSSPCAMASPKAAFRSALSSGRAPGALAAGGSGEGPTPPCCLEGAHGAAGNSMGFGIEQTA